MIVKCVCSYCGNAHTREVPDENPGMSIVERNFLLEQSIRRIRALGHIARHEFR